MATYKRFEDLPVWQDALELMVVVDRLSGDQIFQRKRSYQDQLERATLSISNNIAEGFERGTTKELLMFLYIARGSAGEVRSMTLVFERLPDFSHLKLQITDLRSWVESVSRQIRAWADQLQNSDLTGQRYINEASKKSRQQQEQRLVFEEYLKSFVNKQR